MKLSQVAQISSNVLRNHPRISHLKSLIASASVQTTDYVVSDATPLLTPTARSTKSASARISSGESFSAGIK